MNADREHAQQLLNHLAPDQVAALVHVMEVMLDPLSRKLANSPLDDEPFTQEDRQAVAEADEWLKHNKPIPLEEVLSEFGLTMADWETMGKTPLPGTTLSCSAITATTSKSPAAAIAKTLIADPFY